MTAEEQLVADMRQLLAERPEIATPDYEFVKKWAYGNAGLEDDRITQEQVERVLRQKEAT